ncbi:MAG: ATP-binding cassette domain-containing protein [Actinobacteria bacterium]|nr:ATP-binding cassette domain-containing protein [Actinomycetota bacterium]
MLTKPDGDVLLEVRDLKVHFGLRGNFAQRLLGASTGSVRAVDGVSLQLRRGEVLGLVGESGSGKTTLGRALLGLARVTGGDVRFGGEPISGLGERQFRPLRRRIQMVFQDPHASLNPSMTLLEAVGHPLLIHGIARDARTVRQAVSDSLERVGLVPVERFLHKYPSDLSGGQKQRAVLARAIILGPELVVADEPVSMLDMSVRAKVLQLMLDLKNELGLTYLYVTHDLATARFFCDRIAIMYLGKIVEIGAATEVYARPRHPYTASLVNAIPVPDPRHQVPRDLPRGEVPDAVSPPLGCAFHPRCPRAFEPCGWESRDLRAMLEARWAGLPPEEFQRERRMIGDLARLATPSLRARIPASSGHTGSDIAAMLAAHREEHPDEPLWRGVAATSADPAGLAVEFRRYAEPVLQDVGNGSGATQVACHLYRDDLAGALAASGQAATADPAVPQRSGGGAGDRRPRGQAGAGPPA